VSLTSSANAFAAGVAALFRRYAEWLVSISWKRFILLSLLLLIVAGILSNIPPFTWDLATRTTRVPANRNVDIQVDEQGVRITPKRPSARGAEIVIDEHGVQIRRRADPEAGKPAEEVIIDEHGAQIRREPQVTPEVKPEKPAPQAAPGAPRSLAENIRREVTDEVRRELDQEELAGEIRREVADAIGELGAGERVVHITLGEHLPSLAFLFIMLSAALKIAYAGRVKAEAKAAEAQQMADAESLQRQLAEARMAAMQAQVEPHFLFNTLASIDHLIETDPPRASRMQKNLIALLRASMPAMRQSATHLGRELDVVRPYLEILKVRMGERLQARVNVPEGLYSADFPPMMLQSLVENAIKHGLEPKAEGGALAVSAEVVHGKLAVTVADSGVGFARAATAGTGMGLQNIRERLKLIYGDAAELRIAENTPSGTRVSIVVPYKAT
jgi:hypothetical protein